MRKLKRRKGKNRVKISFAATILVLSAVTIVVYTFSFRVPTYSIPSTLPPYGGIIGRYAPAGALQVSFENTSAVRAINATAVPDVQLVNLVKPQVTVHMHSVQAEVLVTVLNTAAGINDTATAAVLDGPAYSTLSETLSGSSLVPVQQQGFSIYRVNDSSNGRTKAEWVTLVPAGSSVIFAEGGAGAKAVILRMLSVWEGQSPSILTARNVTRMLYPVGGTGHLALSIQNFTGEVLSSSMGVLTVDDTGGQVVLSHVVRFSSQGTASSQIQAVKNVFRFAGDYSQWEESVKAIEYFSASQLGQAVRLAGV
jgi:hypothetical protein